MKHLRITVRGYTFCYLPSTGYYENRNITIVIRGDEKLLLWLSIFTLNGTKVCSFILRIKSAGSKRDIILG